MDVENVLERLVRVGVVDAVDAGRRRARVRYPDTRTTSGWLCVLQHFAANIHVEPDGEHTHVIEDTFTAGGNASVEPEHDHPTTHLTQWMPAVGERVVALYLPIVDGDGFIIGGI